MSEFLSENIQFLVVKFSIYLNRRVFEMRDKHGNTCTPKSPATITGLTALPKDWITDKGHETTAYIAGHSLN